MNKGANMTDIFLHEYQMTRIKTGEKRTEQSNLFQYDFVKQFYPDILTGQYFSATSNRFYSPTNGYILLESLR
jgi:hypothetical protein